MEIAKYVSDGTTRTYAPPCTFKAALNLGVYVNNVYIDRDAYELIRGQVLFKSTTIPSTGTTIEIRVDNTVSDITTASLDDLNICADNIDDIKNVADRIDDVLALSPSMNSVEIVANNIDDILDVHSTIVPNIAEILQADTNANTATTQANNAANQASLALGYANSASASASTATTKANEASASASGASTSESNALSYKNSAQTSASNASSSATQAQGYANDANTAKNTALSYRDTTQGYMNTTQGYMNNASTSATNASNSATSASNTLNDFNNKYVNSATAPTSPTEGMLWYDSVSNIMKVYAGNGWISAGSSVNGTANRQAYVATEGQTVFSGLSYDAGFVDVYVNGIKLVPTEFAATNGTTVVLSSAVPSGTNVEVVAYGTFELADAYTKAEVDAIANTKAPLASPALTGTPTAPTATAGTNTTQVATTEFVNSNYVALTGDQTISGNKSFNGNLLVASPTSALGYRTGAGGTVTQLTSKTEAVTLNKPTGLITLNNSALGSGQYVPFALYNNLITATDMVYVSIVGGGRLSVTNSYEVRTNVGYTGVCEIILKNVHTASLSEPVQILFAIIKGASI